MNLPLKLRKCFNLFMLLASAWLLTGCVWPHTTVRSKEVRGRVLDAQTHLPIKHARVAFCDPPYHTEYTDTDGYFRMKAEKNFHWLVGADGSGYPNRKSNCIQISHEKYEGHGGHWEGDIGDILLQPNQ